MKTLLLFLFLGQVAMSQDRVKFVATGVTCSLCSNAIHKSLSQDKSIIKIEPDLETQEWLVIYKKGEFKTTNLNKRVEDAGFSIAKIYFNDSLVLDKTRKNKKK